MTGSLQARYERAGDVATTIDPPTRAALGEITARALRVTGVRPRDVVQVTQTIDSSGTAWPVLWALDQLDAVVVPTSGLRATPALRQLEFLRRFGVTALCTDEAVVDALTEAAAVEGIDLTTSPVRRIVLSVPALPPARRRQLQSVWDASVFCVYPSREAPVWAAAECEASRRADGSLGLHLMDERVAAELDERSEVLTEHCPCGFAAARVRFGSED